MMDLSILGEILARDFSYVGKVTDIIFMPTKKDFKTIFLSANSLITIVNRSTTN